MPVGLVSRLRFAIVPGAAAMFFLPALGIRLEDHRQADPAAGTILVHLGGVGGSIRIDPTPTTVSCAVERCAYSLPDGSLVRLTASASEAGSRFVRWTGACERIRENRCYLHARDERRVSALFSPVYIGLEALGKGTLTVSPTGKRCVPTSKACFRFAYGTRVEIRANPARKENLRQWLDDCRKTTGLRCRLKMTDNREVSALFSGVDISPTGRETTFTISLIGAGTGIVRIRIGSKTVMCEKPTEERVPPCSRTVRRGRLINLSAQPTGSSRFVGWKGRCPKGAQNCLFVNVRDSSGRLPKISASFAP